MPRISDTYRYSTATMVVRLHLNVMFLHTLPVLLKDNIPVNGIFWDFNDCSCVAGMHSSAGKKCFVWAFGMWCKIICQGVDQVPKLWSWDTLSECKNESVRSQVEGSFCFGCFRKKKTFQAVLSILPTIFTSQWCFLYSCAGGFHDGINLISYLYMCC